MKNELSDPKTRTAADLMKSVFEPEDASIISVSDAEKLLQQMDFARRIAADTPDLTEKEAKLYRANCQVIRHTRVAIIFRNHALLQVFECRQWREQYRSVVEFAKNEADMSKSQLYKSLDEARVVVAFAQEKLTNCMPVGRYVELLVRLPDEFWIPAWALVLQGCRTDGLSLVTARDILRDFCRDRKLPFARRKANGEGQDPPFSSFLLASPKEDGIEAAPPEDWRKKLSVEEEMAVCGMLSDTLLKTLEAAFKKPSAEIILDTLTEAGSYSQFSEEELRDLSIVLNLLREHEPLAYRHIALQALNSLKATLSSKLLQRAEKNLKGKADYAKKRGNPTVSLQESDEGG